MRRSKNTGQEEREQAINNYFEEETREVPKDKNRPIPRSDLDFNLMTTNPEWGGQGIPENLKKELKLKDGQEVDYIEEKPDGTKIVYVKDKDDRNIWELLGGYTRDIRLGNITETEIMDVEHFINLAQDTTNERYPMATKTATSRYATILETSHSRKGWFRRILSTFIKREEHITLDSPKKKSFLGGNKS